MAQDILNSLKKIKAIADIGLLYSSDDYNKERYLELKNIAVELMSAAINVPITDYEQFYAPTMDYPTPKVDVRAFIINEHNEVLLVQEKADNCWTLPGGWADVGLTPKESILKEIKEEIGRTAKVENLLAVFDKKMHPHPPQPYYVYKMIFHCTLTDNMEAFKTAFDTLDIQYFPLDELPSLSKDRILESQIKTVFEQLQSTHPFPICD